MTRADKLVARLKEMGLDGLLVLKDANMAYLSGFRTNDAFVLVSETCRALITDTRYTEQAAAVCTEFEVVPWRTPHPPVEDVILGLCRKHGIRRLGYESEGLVRALFNRVSPKLSAAGIDFVSVGELDKDLKPAQGVVDMLRYVKDEQEVAAIRKACEVSEKALEQLLPFIKPGVTEIDLATKLRELMVENGGSPQSACFSALAGARSSMPHGTPTSAALHGGDLILFDFGAVVDGYWCDMARTFVVGKASDQQRRMLEVVQQAQTAALAAIKAGVPNWLPDSEARNPVLASEFKDHIFTYGVGHGVALEVHEIPFMFPGNQQQLAVGNVITSEPGIYIPNVGGIRIEDVMVVTEQGYEKLTKFPWDLFELA